MTNNNTNYGVRGDYTSQSNNKIISKHRLKSSVNITIYNIMTYYYMRHVNNRKFRYYRTRKTKRFPVAFTNECTTRARIDDDQNRKHFIRIIRLIQWGFLFFRPPFSTGTDTYCIQHADGGGVGEKKEQRNRKNARWVRSNFERRSVMTGEGGISVVLSGVKKKKEKNSSNTFMEKKNRRFTGIGEISWKRVFIVFFFFCCPRFARVFSRTRRPRIDFYTRSASGGEWRVRVQYITDGRTFVYDIYIYYFKGPSG